MDTKHFYLSRCFLVALLCICSVMNLKCIANDDNDSFLSGNEVVETSNVVEYSPPINVSGLAISDSYIRINAGENHQLTAITNPPNMIVQWSSSNPAVVSVSSTGLVTAHKESSSPVYISVATVINMQMVIVRCEVYVTIKDGMYLLSNKATGLYTDATSYTPNSDVVQWMNNGGYNQRWVIEYIGNGAYSIKNAMSELYLGIDLSGSTNAKAIQSATLNDLSKWYIDRTSTSSFKIASVANSSNNYVLSSPSASSGAGDSIRNYAYTDNTNYRDEWELKKISFKVTNYYDSSFASEPALVQYIPDACDFLNYVYYRDFIISFEWDNGSRRYDIPIDQCPGMANEECDDITCGEDCDNHHKSIKRNSDFLLDEVGDKERILLWTDREEDTYCKNQNDEHITVNSLACVYDYRPVIQFIRMDGTRTNSKQACMSLNIIHEMAHTFGMPDVYVLGSEHSTYNRNHFMPPHAFYCCMATYISADSEEYYDYIFNCGDAFCNGCKETINTLISSAIISLNGV